MNHSFLSRALVGSAPPETALLQGLRVLFNFATIFVLVHPFTTVMLDKPIGFTEVENISSFPYNLISIFLGSSAWFSVDFFLLLSGFFCAQALALAAGDDGLRS